MRLTDKELDAVLESMNQRLAGEIETEVGIKHYQSARDKLLKEKEARKIAADREKNGRPIPDYGDHMTMKVFIEMCESGALIDYDGSGNYASASRVFDKEVSPSDVANRKVDKSFSHVVWFNK